MHFNFFVSDDCAASYDVQRKTYLVTYIGTYLIEIVVWNKLETCLDYYTRSVRKESGRPLYLRAGVHEQLIDDQLQSQVAPAQYYPMLLSSKVSQNKNHYQQKCGILWNDYTTLLFVFCLYTHSQRPSASSE